MNKEDRGFGDYLHGIDPEGRASEWHVRHTVRYCEAHFLRAITAAVVGELLPRLASLIDLGGIKVAEQPLYVNDVMTNRYQRDSTPDELFDVLLPEGYKLEPDKKSARLILQEDFSTRTQTKDLGLYAGSFDLAQLSGSKDYPSWALRMESALIREKLWPAVQQEGHNKAEEAKALLRLFVADGPLTQIKHIEDPCLIWKKLKELYNPSSFTSNLLLIGILFSVEYKGRMEVYLNRLKNNYEELLSRSQLKASTVEELMLLKSGVKT
ncbi:hypothetical protein CDD80_5470 [Ophiocordyceps camponoti-rufipedis]|uniref:DUF4219 domain-containing protein n=1 Tax=Ophiocordyceps camponoti-rufipedis TaxID=2004952 RepID=A0A2C5YV26_9HYPO|nr:hypothetical protein CDD80_5470 [Ophiocordyceps camponoti-rufipedis]